MRAKFDRSFAFVLFHVHVIVFNHDILCKLYQVSCLAKFEHTFYLDNANATNYILSDSMRFTVDK